MRYSHVNLIAIVLDAEVLFARKPKTANLEICLRSSHPHIISIVHRTQSENIASTHGDGRA